MEAKLRSLKLKVLLLALTTLLFSTRPVFAQSGVDRPTRALQVLSPEARAAVQQVDTVLQHATRPTPNGRIDAESGVQRAIYHIKPLSPPPATPEQAARRYLRREHRRFGLPSSLENLTLKRLKKSPAGYHAVFQQRVNGLPVYHGTLKINLDRSLQPISAFNGTYSHLQATARTLNTAPSISAKQASALVAEAISRTGATTKPPELTVYPSSPPRLAWKVVAWPRDVPAEWIMLVDAHAGTFIRGVNAATRLHKPVETKPSKDTESTSREVESIGVSAGVQVDGSGYVFDPDPITTGGASYGGLYADNDDATSDALHSQLFLKPLPDLTQKNGRYYLKGPSVHIIGTNPSYLECVRRRSTDYCSELSSDSTNYTPPIMSDPGGFQFSRTHDGFEAVNAYYHISKIQDYLLSLNPRFADLLDTPIRVNPHGEGPVDNSFYYPALNLISFGTGGVDDAEDGGVIWHEYAHVLLNNAAPGLLRAGPGSEARSFHEGWADYWIGSYRRVLGHVRENLSYGDYDWRELFPWDGNNEFWPGRRLSHSGKYPTSLTYRDTYRNGLLWAATLMDIFTGLELPPYGYSRPKARRVLDRMNLQSHYFLPTNASIFSMRDAAHALLRADLQLYDGKHRAILLYHLENRGFIDPETYGPQIAFNPTRDIQQENGTLQIEVEISSPQFPIETVAVHYRRIASAGAYQTIVLERKNDSLFTGALPVAVSPGLITYYLEATNQLGISQLLPSTGGEQPFLIDVGTMAKTNLLNDLRPTGGWYRTDAGWRIDGHEPSTSKQANPLHAHLVFAPVTLPDNPDARIYFVLNHRYRLVSEAAGNVQFSLDGGRSWQTLSPKSEYPTSNADIPPLEGEGAFTGVRDNAYGVQTVFNLTDYAGRRIQLRVDFGSAEPLGDSTFWSIRNATLYRTRPEGTPSTSRALALHPNYPDPFSVNTTVHFTLPSATSVTLEVYDILGRRVAVITDRHYEAGIHTVTFDGANLAGGIYFIRLTTGRQRTIVESMRVIQ